MKAVATPPSERWRRIRIFSSTWARLGPIVGSRYAFLCPASVRRGADSAQILLWRRPGHDDVTVYDPSEVKAGPTSSSQNSIQTWRWNRSAKWWRHRPKDWWRHRWDWAAIGRLKPDFFHIYFYFHCEDFTDTEVCPIILILTQFNETYFLIEGFSTLQGVPSTLNFYFLKNEAWSRTQLRLLLVEGNKYLNELCLENKCDLRWPQWRSGRKLSWVQEMINILKQQDFLVAWSVSYFKIRSVSVCFCYISYVKCYICNLHTMQASIKLYRK